ncbi:uncharacterized protein LOC141679955 [Apium graveolens]|uniref:uncharacterized protein LOC141679955 n=1 Tax=Apium graveolens TaxID=4045 RepID=UPI003D7A74F2
MRDYNITLLGNQGWRLLKHQEKLVNKIFKARYYPQGNFLSTKIGSNSSYVWRSVLESQEIMKKGIGCRVGNGNSINIELDHWLPVANDPFIHMRSKSIHGQKVSSLFSMENNSWDIDLVKDIFDSRDASIILSIPVDKEVDDSWYWRNNKLAITQSKCPFAISVWDKCNKACVFGTTSFGIKKSLEISELLDSAYSLLNQWRSVQHRTFDRFMGYMTPEDGNEHWSKPHVNSIKINTDATIFEETHSYSFAWIAHNHEGSLVEARSECLRGSPSPELAEVMGIREALSWVMSTNQKNIIESDYLQMVVQYDPPVVDQEKAETMTVYALSAEKDGVARAAILAALANTLFDFYSSDAL